VRRGDVGQPAGGVGEPGKDLVAFPLGVGALLLEVARRVFPGPRRFRACVFGACVGGRGAPVGLLGVLPVPLGLLARLVLAGFGGCACLLGLAYLPGRLILSLPDRLLGSAGGLIGPLLGVGLCPRDRLGRLGADPFGLGGMRGGGFGQPVVSFAGPGLLGGQVRPSGNSGTKSGDKNRIR